MTYLPIIAKDTSCDNYLFLIIAIILYEKGICLGEQMAYNKKKLMKWGEPMDLKTCRNEIDCIDRELTTILEARMKIVASVAAYKKEHHMEIYDPRREQEVLDKIANLAVDKDLAPYLKTIYQCIMDESKRYERDHMDR